MLDAWTGCRRPLPSAPLGKGLGERRVATFTVTGGAGFIGSHLVDALIGSGHRVAVLDDFSTGKAANVPRGARVVRGDVTDTGAVREALAGSDGCFHLAAIASVVRGNEEWLSCHRVNQSGTVAVMEAARDAGRVPVVFASSAATYGDTAGEVAREASPPAPITSYGVDKLGSEMQARIAHLVHGIPTLGCRFFNVYGPRQDPSSPYSGVISIFAQRLLRGLELAIHGDGMQTRDFIFVPDVVEHLLAAMDLLQRTEGAEVVNVCTGTGTSIQELAQALASVVGVDLRLSHGPTRQGDIRTSVGDPSRARELLGCGARTALQDGLRATVESLRTGCVAGT